jgi:hypothetical protein
LCVCVCVCVCVRKPKKQCSFEGELPYDRVRVRVTQLYPPARAVEL